MGPVEERLRARLRYGLGLTRTEVHRFGGPLARGVLDRLVRDGEAVEREGRYVLAGYTPDPSALAAEEAARRARLDLARAVEADRQRRERERSEMAAARERMRAEIAKREAAQRQLFAGLSAYRNDEREAVLAERRAALAECGQ